MKILIIDDFEPSLMRNFKEHNISFEYAPYMDRSELIQCISNYSGLILRSKTFIDKEIMDASKNLFFIARGGSGMDSLDVEYAHKKGIVCLNAPEGNRNAVAEHCIGLIFNLLSNIQKGTREIQEKVWDREGNRGEEIGSKTVGIIGYGNVGSTLATKLSAIGAKVIAYDKYKKGFGTESIQEVSLKDIFELSDIVSFHIPLTDETKNMVDLEFLGKFKKPIHLINTSRGKVLKLEDAVTKLEEGKILGMGLDVLENEKIESFNEKQNYIFNKLINCKNVVLTPHVAGWTKESYKGISEVLANKIIKLLIKSDFFARELLINLKN